MPNRKKRTPLILGAGAIIFIIVVYMNTYLLFPSPTDQKPIRFAYQNRIGSAICIVAVEKNYFAEQGVPVESYRFNSGPACAEALFTGSADIATMGDTTAIIALSRDARLKILTSHGQGEHRHRLVTRPASVIKTAQDLIGKTIAVKKGTSTHGGMLRYLDAHDVAEDSIQLVDMSPSEMPDALFAGSIEAFAASEPTPSLAEQRGAVQVTSFGGLGNSYPILIMTAQDFIQANPQRIQDFLTALGKAETFIREHPEDTVRILSPITGLSEALTRAAMKRHRFKLDVSEDIIRSLKTTADFMLQQGSITTNPELDKCIAGNRKIVD